MAPRSRSRRRTETRPTAARRLVRWSAVPVAMAALIALAGGCRDDPDAEATLRGQATDDPSAPTTAAGNSSGPDSDDASAAATDAADPSDPDDPTGTTRPDGTTTSTGDRGSDADPVVRLGPITVERNEPCPPVDVAPTFTLTMTSDAGVERVPPPVASTMAVVEGAPTEVAPAASFTVEGDWSLNVQMLEHLSGTMRGTTHTETSRLAERVPIEGTPVDIGWTVTEQGDRVTLSAPTFAVASSCVQVLPGTLVAFTDAGGRTVSGSIEPDADEPIDLPLGQPVTVFDGEAFATSSDGGWELRVTIVEHWNGRTYDSGPHTDPGPVAATLPPAGDGDPWEVRYRIELG